MSATFAPVTPAPSRPPSVRLRLAGATLAALVANAVVTTATDQLLHELGVYPPWGQPMPDPGDNALALAYRVVYGVLGGCLAAALAARLAPRGAAGAPTRAPMRAALAYGIVGLVLSAVGGWVAVTQYHTGPAWYPILLAAVCVPCGWLGGALQARWSARRRPAVGAY
jgi:hypothetical protein